MEGAVDTPDALVDAGDGFVHPLVLLPGRVPQQLRLLQDLRRLEVPHAYGSLPSVDVVADHDGMLRRPRRDGKLDLRILGGEFRQVELDERTGNVSTRTGS